MKIENDFSKMDDKALAASLTETNEKAKALFALDEAEVTIEQADEAAALMASAKEHEAEQATRATAAKEAGEKFAAAKAAFTADASDGDDEGDDEDAEDGDEDGDDADEDGDDEDAEDGDDVEVEAAAKDEEDDEKKKPFSSKITPAKAAPKASAAKAVGRKTKRPAVQAAEPVTITAAAGIQGFTSGQKLTGMDELGNALISVAKGFPKFNMGAAKKVRSQSGGEPVIHKAGLASFDVPVPASLTASTGNDYSAVKAAMKAHEAYLAASMSGEPAALAAAGGWCAPSEPVYSYIADYVVDGLITVPEVSAPRGGLLITTGPAKSNDTADFGFVQTEEQAEAGDEKSLESIVCPDFVDHRLDAIGYGITIPILTQKAYPELITDALRFAGVLYAHKVNKRLIDDIVALSTPVTFNGYGPSLTDSLEVLTIVAVKERRKHNIGENAIMEVKVPTFAREVFRADMSRRTGLALSDVATDQKIAAEFTARRLAVEYVSDWEELSGANPVLPGSFPVLIYPQGTFIKAVEDVINLSAIYDAASIVVNEYTGVFFEQGIMVAQAGYSSTLLDIPINTAGETGAAILQGLGDAISAGSF